MSSFKFKRFKSIFKKKPHYHKAAPLPPTPEGYRLPWSDYLSPLKIVFVDHDEARGGMKFAELVSTEDKPNRFLILDEDVYDGLNGNAPQNVVDEFRSSVEKCAEWTDAEIREHIKSLASDVNKYTIRARGPQPEGAHCVELMPTHWIEMLIIQLYASANNIPIGYDEDADVVISGYDLFARGAMNKSCKLVKSVTQPSTEQRAEFAYIFDLIEGEDRAIGEANKRAMHLLMREYERNLEDTITANTPHPDHMNYWPAMAHHLRAVRTWIAEQVLDAANLPGTDACMVRVDKTTGAISVYGNEAGIDKLIDTPKNMGKFLAALEAHPDVIKVAEREGK